VGRRQPRPYRTACGSIWGNGGDIAGYSNTFMNSEHGKYQAAVMTDTNPAPEGVDERRGRALHTAMGDALGRPEAC
jgi:hypothetical protein